MFIVFLLIAFAFMDRLFSYLGMHDSMQALPEGKKLVRLRQLLVVSVLCMCLASLLAIVSYFERKHSEVTTSAADQQNTDWKVRVEALLAEKCARLAENNSVGQQCLDEITRLRTELGRSASQGRASKSPRSDAPIRTETAFLRPWYPGTLLTNQFSRSLNPPVDLAPAEPKHYSASLGETLALGDKVRSSSAHMGVYPVTGLPGGPCVDTECTDIIADASN
jgi:hypothetical protein